MKTAAKYSRNLAGSLVILALLCLVALVWAAGGELDATGSKILYVDGASGSDGGNDCQDDGDPCATIGHAIGEAGIGDEIWVAEGSYEETLDIATQLMLNGGYEAEGWTRDIGGYPTIIDAKGADASVFSIYPGIAVTLEGFTVQGANHTSNWGGGININAATVVISATIIQNNKTSGGGGGIWIEEEGGGEPASLKVINSKVLNNQAGYGGGVHGSPGTTIDIIGSRIADNSASGEGGGVGVSGDAGRPTQLTIDDSIIANNQAVPHGGALTVFNGTASLTNVLIHGNRTTAGPASVLMAGDSQVSIVNSTMAGNNPQGHQAINISTTDLDVTNSIMWNNALNIQAESPTSPRVKVNYSDVEGECSWCAAGQGNIDKAPRFVAAASDDYRLRSGSPCIDAGTATAAPADDIVGTPRDSQPDMGAYEWQGYRIFLPATLRRAMPQ